MKKVEKTVNDTAIILTLTGQLDTTDSKILSKLMETELERDVVVFDLTKVTYMNSSVLGQMVAIRTKVNAANFREPIIVGCNEHVFNLFELTGVAHFFRFVSA